MRRNGHGLVWFFIFIHPLYSPVHARKILYIILNWIKTMELLKEIDSIIEEVKDEAKNLEIAETKEEEIEALKEMLDALMRGARQVQEKLDQYNERRYR